MTEILPSRRRIMILAGAVGTLAGTTLPGFGEDEKVTANEDLMREHGVLRRILLVYREAARRAKDAPAEIPLAALHKAASLFRDFGEEYHERKLEEAYIFPELRKISPQLKALADTLQMQHGRGREITAYILDISSRGTFPGADARSFAKAMREMDWMYENHAAREDTIVFPAWKKAVGPKRYDALGDKFEDIEQETFGHDGFDDAVEQIAQIEAAFGLSDIAGMMAPQPPKI